jgi:hypothetical protein
VAQPPHPHLGRLSMSGDIPYHLMQWNEKTLNHKLGSVFQCWYPDLQLEEEFLAA